MPIFREHGLPFTEPEIPRVFPVDERAGRAGKVRASSMAGCSSFFSGQGRLPPGRQQNERADAVAPALVVFVE